MVEPYFGDIRNIILDQLRAAQFDIYVAVAWITDKNLLDILVNKAEDGLNVQVVMVKDDINLNNGFDYNKFIEVGGQLQLFWNDHHHKFCVIDRKTVITGSYNWTYKANNRFKRENIILIKGEESLIEQYSKEFSLLLKSSERFKAITLSAESEPVSSGKATLAKKYDIIQGYSTRLALFVELDTRGKRMRQIFANVDDEFDLEVGDELNLEDYVIEQIEGSDGVKRYWITG